MFGLRAKLLGSVMSCMVAVTAAAQVREADAPLPDAPSAKVAEAASRLEVAQSVADPEQDSFRSRVVFHRERPGLTSEDKFHLFVKQGYSPYLFASAGLAAGVAQATGGTPGFGAGWGAYGKRYGAAVADAESGAFFKKFLLPVLFRQDPRYKRSRDEGFRKRLFHALSRLVETETDTGAQTFNSSQVLGTAISAGLSNAYYPQESRGFGRTGQRAMNSMAADAGANILKEFWPDIRDKLFGRKPAPSALDAAPAPGR